MFKIKDGGKTKRVQNFNFRPDQVEESVIRLTESDLHRIVKESVQKILTEMDWKTYANAAKKRLQQYSGFPTLFMRTIQMISR